MYRFEFWLCLTRGQAANIPLQELALPTAELELSGFTWQGSCVEYCVCF